MVYESSFECGRKPFRPDTTRGTWASPSDFVFAAIGLAFRLDIFALSMSVGYLSLTPVVFITYLLCLCAFVVPIFVIQSFMGQFSSSGFISAFRLTPIFKSIGYISLALNISILTYYSMFAAIPMVFLFNSLRPTFPWGCDGIKQWLNDNQGAMKHICNFETTKDSNVTYEYEQNYLIGGLYFGSHFGTYEIDMFSFLYERDFVVSWQMLLCTMLTWLAVACLFWKFYNTQTFGKIIRFTMGTTLVLLLLCLGRFCFLPGSENRLSDYFFPSEWTIHDLFYSVPLLTVSSFGAGWGSIIVLSSFNKFRTNIMRQSWLILLGQTVVWLSLGGIAFLIKDYLNEFIKGGHVSYAQHHLILYLPAADVLGSMGWPNFWSILYYGMLTLAAFVTMLTQLFGIFTSIFDEYESLRTRKSTVIFSLLGFLALCSLYSCTSHGIYYFRPLSVDGILTQIALNLLLLLVVLWIYGRVRFQRDIEFMLGQRFATWKVYMLRFVSPLALIVIFLAALFAAVVLHFISGLTDFFVAVFFIVLPWLFVPGYMIFILLQTTGRIMMRLKRCCRPNDWYPVDMEERQRYEDAMGNLDITHQLKEVDEQIVVP